MEQSMIFFQKIYPLICKSMFSEKATARDVNFIEKILKLPRGAKILDLCSGQGRHAIKLAQRGFFLFCQDTNIKLLRSAKKMASDLSVNITTICKDMREIPFKNKFDAVINMWSSFGYFKTTDQNLIVLKQVSKALKPSGKFLVDLDNKEWLFRHLKKKSKYCNGQIEVNGVSQIEKEKGEIKTKLILLRNHEIFEKAELIMKYYSFEDMKSMLNSVNFRIIAAHGDFKGERYFNKSPRMIILSEKR